jgi:hypothetical protein
MEGLTATYHLRHTTAWQDFLHADQAKQQQGSYWIAGIMIL